MRRSTVLPASRRILGTCGPPRAPLSTSSGAATRDGHHRRPRSFGVGPWRSVGPGGGSVDGLAAARRDVLHRRWHSPMAVFSTSKKNEWLQENSIQLTCSSSSSFRADTNNANPDNGNDNDNGNGSENVDVYGSDNKDGGNKRVYVGNLSWSTTFGDLARHARDVAGCEVVSARVQYYRDGCSKGCGIIEFSSADDAQVAAGALQDTELDGRMLFAREDREEEGFRALKDRMEPGSKVFVGNLGNASWKDLKDHFATVAEVDWVDVRRGYGFVRFRSAKNAKKAMEVLNGVELRGRRLNVRLDNKA